MTTILPTIERLLRNPLALVDDDSRDAGARARFLVFVILIAGAAFGGVLGLGRGGIQVVFAAIKLPLAMLLTAAVCAPCLTAFNYAFERPHNLRRDVLVVLSVLAIGSLVIAAMIPVVLLGLAYRAGYHLQILIAVGCCLLGGAVALRNLERGLGTQPQRGIVAIATITVFMLVGGQMAWSLRPFVVRPKSPIVGFRSLESSFVESVVTSTRSSMGIYRREPAPDAVPVYPDETRLPPAAVKTEGAAPETKEGDRAND